MSRWQSGGAAKVRPRARKVGSQFSAFRCEAGGRTGRPTAGKQSEQTVARVHQLREPAGRPAGQQPPEARPRGAILLPRLLALPAARVRAPNPMGGRHARAQVPPGLVRSFRAAPEWAAQIYFLLPRAGARRRARRRRRRLRTNNNERNRGSASNRRLSRGCGRRARSSQLRVTRLALCSRARTRTLIANSRTHAPNPQWPGEQFDQLLGPIVVRAAGAPPSAIARGEK